MSATDKVYYTPRDRTLIRGQLSPAFRSVTPKNKWNTIFGWSLAVLMCKPFEGHGSRLPPFSSLCLMLSMTFYTVYDRNAYKISQTYWEYHVSKHEHNSIFFNYKKSYNRKNKKYANPCVYIQSMPTFTLMEMIQAELGRCIDYSEAVCLMVVSQRDSKWTFWDLWQRPEIMWKQSEV